MDKYLEAEKRLGELLGWRELHTIEVWDSGKGFSRNTLFGRKPGSKSQWPDQFPCYARDKAANHDLMIEHAAYPKSHVLSDSIVVADQLQYIDDHATKSAAVMHAVVLAVIAKLEATGEKNEG